MYVIAKFGDVRDRQNWRLHLTDNLGPAIL